jgi:capsid protein
MNARDAFHDTPQVKALVDRVADSVAYTGLRLECAPLTSVLGISLEEAEKWSTKVEESFDLWAQSKKQHRSESMTWYQAHRQYQIYQHRDNDVFIRLFYSRDRNLLNSLQWEFIDPDQIRGDAFTSTAGPLQPGFGDGIVRDDRGREKAYKLWVFDQKNNYKMLELPVRGARSGRLLMLHGYSPEYAGQGRGYSRLSHVLQEFQDLTDFSLAHIKNAIMQSNFPLYVKPSADSPADNPFLGQMSDRGVTAVSQFGATPAPDSAAQNVTPESLRPVNYCPLPEVTFDAPGTAGVFSLKEGQDLKTLQLSTPSQNYDGFVGAFISHLSASMSVPVEILLMKFNANYSASRASLIMFWRVSQIWKAEMEADCLNPVYEMWLSEEIASGRISAPGWSDPRMRAAWLNSTWVGAPMPNIDPARTAVADQKYVEMGAQTLEQVARKHNGSSGTANRAKLKREIEELVVPPWSKKAGGGK